MKGVEGLKHLKMTRTLVLLIISEITIIELVAFLPFGTVHSSSSSYGFSDDSRECVIIIFKKDYFLGRAKVRIKPHENSVVTLLFPSGKILNITSEYAFGEVLLPGSRCPFEGFTFEFNYSNPLFFEESFGPHYVFVGSKEELEKFLPHKVPETMSPFYLVTARGKISEIEVEVYGVVPWNKS